MSILIVINRISRFRLLLITRNLFISRKLVLFVFCIDILLVYWFIKSHWRDTNLCHELYVWSELLNILMIFIFSHFNSTHLLLNVFDIYLPLLSTMMVWKILLGITLDTTLIIMYQMCDLTRNCRKCLLVNKNSFLLRFNLHLIISNLYCIMSYNYLTRIRIKY